MRVNGRQNLLRPVGVWLLAATAWLGTADLAESSEPINGVVALVNELHEVREIQDALVAQDLVDKLQNAGALADAGDKDGAVERLDVLTQEITRLNGVVMTEGAASQLVDRVTKAKAEL